MLYVWTDSDALARVCEGAVWFIFRLQPAASRHPDSGHRRLVYPLVTPSEAERSCTPRLSQKRNTLAYRRTAASSKPPRSVLEPVAFPTTTASIVSSELRFHSRTDAVSFHPSSLLLSGHSVFSRHGTKVTKVKVFPCMKHIHWASCMHAHNIQSNRRNKSVRWLLLLYWFSLWVIPNWLEISALIEIIGICTEGNLHAAEQHGKQLKCTL